MLHQQRDLLVRQRPRLPSVCVSYIHSMQCSRPNSTIVIHQIVDVCRRTRQFEVAIDSPELPSSITSWKSIRIQMRPTFHSRKGTLECANFSLQYKHIDLENTLLTSFYSSLSPVMNICSLFAYRIRLLI